MSILGNLFGSSKDKSQENASAGEDCCSVQIEEIPEEERAAADAQPKNGTAPEASASEAPASESGGCCGNGSAAEAKPAREEETPA